MTTYKATFKSNNVRITESFILSGITNAKEAYHKGKELASKYGFVLVAIDEQKSTER